MRSIAVAVIALLCFPASAQDGGVMASEDAVMKASLVEGMVTMVPSTGGGPGPLQEDDLLHQGDTVITQPGARLEITFASGTVIRVGESTRLTLGEVVPKKAFSAKIFFGNVWAKVHKLLASETFHLETENGVAGVRGTEFRLEVAPGKDDLLRVYEGVVQVDAKDGKWSHRVEASHELRFHKDREPKGAAKFDPAAEKGHRFMEWVRARKENFKYKNPEREHKKRKHER
jgi:hypothetical protein